MKQHKILIIGIIVGILLTILIGSFFIVNPPKKINKPIKTIKSVKLNKFSYAQKREKIEKKYKYFSEKMTSLEILYKFTSMYNNVKYRSGGDLKFKKADCLGVVFDYWWELGGNMEVVDIPTLIKRLDTFVYISKDVKDKAWVTERIYNFKDIKPNNLIVFRPIGGIWHLGIIWGKKNGYLKYMDMNVKTSMGVKEIKFGSYRVYKVYKIGFDYFSGDLLNERR